MQKESGRRIKLELKQRVKSDGVTEKGVERLPDKVTLPSLEDYMALMHVTPSAKGMAIVLPVKPITVEY